VELRVLVDRGSIEVFVNSLSEGFYESRVGLSVAAVPDEKNRKVELIPQGGDITVKYATVYRLKSAWEK
jgi:hypothetical protein